MGMTRFLLFSLFFSQNCQISLLFHFRLGSHFWLVVLLNSDFLGYIPLI